MDTVLRIGELSRRSGISPDLLRAWERRYGLLQPVRSPGGLRLYSEQDVERVRAMRRHLAEGLAAAEAAARALRPDTNGSGEAGAPLDRERLELTRALDEFDEPAAQAALDRGLATAGIDAVLLHVVLPYLRELGERWERGEASVAQEHYASNVLRGRLLALTRGWGRGFGPLALLACIAGEQHDLGLIAFGLALHGRGWRVAYLGADTPFDTLTAVARSLAPELVVLNVATDERLRASLEQLRALVAEHRVAVGGGGAAGAASVGAIVLLEDPVAAAERLTEEAGRSGTTR
jgi:DNA-binding transcriptional MerR regulator